MISLGTVGVARATLCHTLATPVTVMDLEGFLRRFPKKTESNTFHRLTGF